LSLLIKLQKVTLEDNQIEDLTPLFGLGLMDLFVKGNQITNLEALSGMPLEQLDISANPIADLDRAMEVVGTIQSLTALLATDLGLKNIEGIRGLTNLGGIDLQRNEIQDISALEGMKDLVIVWLNDNQLTTLHGLEGLGLQLVEAYGNQLTDIQALADVQITYRLDLSDNQIVDISALATASIEGDLHVNGNQIKDLSVLSGKNGIINLFAHDNAIEEIEVFRNLGGLRGFTLWNNKINNISPLLSSPALGPDSLMNGVFDFSRNRIQDISPLASFPPMGLLDIEYNMIEDLSPLRGRVIYTLNVTGNNIHDIGVLTANELKLGEFTSISDNPISSIGAILFLGGMGHEPNALLAMGLPTDPRLGNEQFEQICAWGNDVFWGEDSVCESWTGEILEDDDSIEPEAWGGPADHGESCGVWRDALAENGAIPGAERAAGEFVVSQDVEGEPVVTDNVTRLVWRRCVEGMSWDGATCSGTPEMAFYADAAASCAGSYGGFDDWRAPTLFELESLLDFGEASDFIDVATFPATPADKHWSSTGAVHVEELAKWTVDFQSGWLTGEIVDDSSDGHLPIRCVRSDAPAPTAPLERFVVSSDGLTVEDTWSALVWQRCATGAAWDGTTCAGTPEVVVADDAAGLCDGSFGGFDDWRVPELPELLSIVNPCGHDPASYASAFPVVVPGRHWSATATNDANLWWLDFSYGQTRPGTADETSRVLCVRGN